MTHLDSLVGSTRDQSRTCLVKGRTEDTLRDTYRQLVWPLLSDQRTASESKLPLWGMSFRCWNGLPVL
jgi:hypothetical protein